MVLQTDAVALVPLCTSLSLSLSLSLAIFIPFFRQFFSLFLLPPTTTTTTRRRHHHLLLLLLPLPPLLLLLTEKDGVAFRVGLPKTAALRQVVLDEGAVAVEGGHQDGRAAVRVTLGQR